MMEQKNGESIFACKWFMGAPSPTPHILAEVLLVMQYWY